MVMCVTQNKLKGSNLHSRIHIARTFANARKFFARLILPQQFTVSDRSISDAFCYAFVTSLDLKLVCIFFQLDLSTGFPTGKTAGGIVHTQKKGGDTGNF